MQGTRWPNWPISCSNLPSRSPHSATTRCSAMPTTSPLAKRQSCLWVVCPSTSRWMWRSDTHPTFKQQCTWHGRSNTAWQLFFWHRSRAAVALQAFPDHLRRHQRAPQRHPSSRRPCPHLRLPHVSVASHRPSRRSDSAKGSATIVMSLCPWPRVSAHLLRRLSHR